LTTDLKKATVDLKKQSVDLKMSTLANTLFGHTRGAVLAMLYGHVGESFYLRQLSRATGISFGTVQREVRQLTDAGLLVKKNVGQQTFYSANENSPVFQEIKSLVVKTVGVRDVLATALAPLSKIINVAFVYGSIARLSDTTKSDIDLMVIGKVDFESVVSKLTDAQRILNREINPTVYSWREFRSKIKSNFLRNVLAGNKLFAIGEESDLRELGQS
jgi:DNA-binding transcriptional ArsR family regulator